MKRGLVLGMTFALLAAALVALHCGGGVREGLTQLELRTVQGLQADEVRYLFNNERLDAYQALVRTARDQLDELAEPVEIERGEVAGVLARVDEDRASDHKQPLIYVRLTGQEAGWSLGALVTDEALINPVAFMDTVPAETAVEFVYPEGAWSEQARDDLLGNSELGVLHWLEPWTAALAKGTTRLEILRAEGQAAFVALGPEAGQLHVNPVLLHLAAARSHAVSSAAAAAANQPLVVVPAPAQGVAGQAQAQPGAGAAQAQPKDGLADTQAIPRSVDGADGVNGAVAGQLAQIEQAATEADVTGCTCACFDDGSGDCTHICYHDPDAPEGADECHYGCADDPDSCATVTPVFGTDAHARKTLGRVFHLGALALPALVLLSWVRRIRRRKD